MLEAYVIMPKDPLLKIYGIKVDGPDEGGGFVVSGSDELMRGVVKYITRNNLASYLIVL